MPKLPSFRKLPAGKGGTFEGFRKGTGWTLPPLKGVKPPSGMRTIDKPIDLGAGKLAFERGAAGSPGFLEGKVGPAFGKPTYERSHLPLPPSRGDLPAAMAKAGEAPAEIARVSGSVKDEVMELAAKFSGNDPVSQRMKASILEQGVRRGILMPSEARAASPVVFGGTPKVQPGLSKGKLTPISEVQLKQAAYKVGIKDGEQNSGQFYSGKFTADYVRGYQHGQAARRASLGS